MWVLCYLWCSQQSRRNAPIFVFPFTLWTLSTFNWVVVITRQGLLLYIKIIYFSNILVIRNRKLSSHMSWTMTAQLSSLSSLTSLKKKARSTTVVAMVLSEIYCHQESICFPLSLLHHLNELNICPS